MFDSNPRLCGEQEGGGTTGDGCPKVELHKTWGNQAAPWCCDCGRYDGPQFLLEGRAKEDSVLTADSRRGTARLPTRSLRKD